MTNAKKDAIISKKELDSLQNEMTDLKDFFKKSLSEFENKVSGGSNNIEHIAHKAGQHARDYINQASDQAKEVKSQYESTIKENPIKTTLFAFAAGCVVAALLRK